MEGGKPWREGIERGREGDRGRDERGQADTYSDICWHRRTVSNSLNAEVCGMCKWLRSVQLRAKTRVWSRGSEENFGFGLFQAWNTPRKGRAGKSDGVHSGNFNYTLFLAEFGQLIPRLPSLCAHGSRGARCSQAWVPQRTRHQMLDWLVSRCISTWHVHITVKGLTVAWRRRGSQTFESLWLLESRLMIRCCKKLTVCV